MTYESSVQAIAGGVDVYDDLLDKCEEIIGRHSAVVGFIGISNSPSCGISVGVKGLGKVIKGPMHLKSGVPTTEISAMNNEQNRQTFLNRVNKYIQSLHT